MALQRRNNESKRGLGGNNATDVQKSAQMGMYGSLSAVARTEGAAQRWKWSTAEPCSGFWGPWSRSLTTTCTTRF